MPKKVVVYKKVETHPGVIRKVPLRNIQVTDSFVGIGKHGKPIMSEFLSLAHDLERGEVNLGVDVLNV